MQFAEFPESEYRDRYQRLITAGRQSGIDAFVFTDEYNLRYFAGGPLTDAFIFRDDYIGLVIPTDPDQEPEFIFSESRMVAAYSSWIKRKRTWGGSIGSIGDSVILAPLVRCLKDFGLEKGTIAMETSAAETLFMPATTYDAMRATFPQLNVVSAAEIVHEICMIKSPLEINCLRQACAITAEAFEHGFSLVRAGTTEKELIRAIKAEMFLRGADSIPFLTVMAGWTGRSICWDSHATDYRIKPGDPIQVDGGCAVKGYTADMVRTASLGPLRDKRYLELYQATLTAHHNVRDQLRGGAVIHDVCSAGRNSLLEYEALFEDGEVQTGHGIGLSIHEAPFLHRGKYETLEPGMVVAIEPALLEKPGIEASTYFTLVENNYVITSTGAECLTNTPEEIRVI